MNKSKLLGQTFLKGLIFALLTNITIVGNSMVIAQDGSNEQELRPKDSTPVQREPELAPDKAEGTSMTRERLTSIIEELGQSVEVTEAGVISFTYDNAQLIAIMSEPANRMRLVAPIIAATEMTDTQMAATLVSNYHLALDARYAVGDGVLYSAYIHPLKELTDEQLRSAIRQVATLRNTFGTSYSSGEMSFAIPTQEEIEI